MILSGVCIFWSICILSSKVSMGSNLPFNAALNSPTYQCCPGSGSLPTRATDGCTNPAYWDGCCIHASSYDNMYVSVDLGQIYRLQSVKLFTRGDGLGANNLRDFQIIGSNVSHDPALATDMTECVNKVGPIGEATSEVFICSSAVFARYVMVYKQFNADHFTVCEMEVYVCESYWADMVDGACVEQNCAPGPVQIISNQHEWQEQLHHVLNDSDHSTCLKQVSSGFTPRIKMQSVCPHKNTATDVTLIGRNLVCTNNQLYHGSSDSSQRITGDFKACSVISTNTAADLTTCVLQCGCSMEDVYTCAYFLFENSHPSSQLCEVVFS